MNLRPIFIAGCDRSGTTLLGDLLGNSRWCVTTPESQFFHDFLIRTSVGAFDNPGQAAQWLQSHFRFAAWDLGIDATQLASLIDLGNPRTTMERLVAHYAGHRHPEKQGADVWIDHTPDNFKYQSMLKRIFPDARFIHIVRDGRAVCASIRPLDWGPNNAYMASRHWARRLQEAMAVEVAEGDNCLRVHFEDLLQNPDRVMHQICNFVDLPFEATMLHGGGLVLPAFTRGQHRLVGSRLDGTRADSWKKDMSDSDLRDFESYPLAHTLLRTLGYEPVNTAPPRISAARTLALYCHEFIHYLWHRSRHRRMERKTVTAYHDRDDRYASTAAGKAALHAAQEH